MLSQEFAGGGCKEATFTHPCQRFADSYLKRSLEIIDRDGDLWTARLNPSRAGGMDALRVKPLVFRTTQNNKRANEQTNTCIHKQTNKQASKQANKQANKQT